MTFTAKFGEMFALGLAFIRGHCQQKRLIWQQIYCQSFCQMLTFSPLLVLPGGFIHHRGQRCPLILPPLGRH